MFGIPNPEQENQDMNVWKAYIYAQIFTKSNIFAKKKTFWKRDFAKFFKISRNFMKLSLFAKIQTSGFVPTLALNLKKIAFDLQVGLIESRIRGREWPIKVVSCSVWLRCIIC